MESRRSLSPQEVPEGFGALLRQLRDDDRSGVLNALLAACRTQGWRTPSLAKALQMNPPAVSKRIERARRQARNNEPGWRDVAAEVEKVEIPKAPQVQAMIDGKQLPDDKIQELLQMQRVAARVNGAMPADHPSRRVSEALSQELNRLIAEEGFSPYYLARVLGRSHRAITSRLERHHFRDPCPSVAGTPSGEYRNRKIGDPLPVDI